MAQERERDEHRVAQGTAPAADTAQQVGHAAEAASGTARNGNAPALNGIDGAAEDRYWRDNYLRRPYADETISYDHYRPAYRYGWESRARLIGQRWDQVERELQRGWRQNRGASRLGWGDAKLAARDAWQRIDHRLADARQDEATL
jgi:hypothetical protein